MSFNLKTIRRLKGYSPQDMTDKLDISLSFYYKIEANTRDFTYALLLKLLMFLNMMMLKSCLKVGPFYEDDDYVFATYSGKPYHERNLRRTLNKI